MRMPQTAAPAGDSFTGGSGDYAAPVSLAQGGTASDASKLGGQLPAFYQTAIVMQTGLGTSLTAFTYTGTYATDYSHLQALHNKVVAIETILRALNFATT